MVNITKFSFKQKVYTYIKYLLSLLFFCISGICLYYGYSLYKKRYIEIPGTIISNLESIRSPYKSTRIYTNYGFLIKPDNSKYKNYYVCVDPATFVSYNVGDHVTFEVDQCQLDPKGTDYSGLGALLIIFGAMIGLLNIGNYFCRISNK